MSYLLEFLFLRITNWVFLLTFLSEHFSGWCLCCCPLWCGSSQFRSVIRTVRHNRKVSSSSEWCCPFCCKKPSALLTTSCWSKSLPQCSQLSFGFTHSRLQHCLCHKKIYIITHYYSVWIFSTATKPVTSVFLISVIVELYVLCWNRVHHTY